MLKLALRRLMLAPLLIAAVTFLLFVMLSLTPGDPAVVLAGESPELVPFIRESLNLDDPLPVRYVSWAGDAITGDFGESYQLGNATVSTLLESAAPVTLSLAGLAMVIALLGTL